MSFGSMVEAFDVLNLARAEDPSCLNENQHQIWKELRGNIESALFKQTPPPQADRRDHIRIPLTVLVRYWSHREFVDRVVPVFGEGGLFISIQDPFEVGTEFDLQISVISYKFSLKTKACVVWVKRDGDSDQRGMGVQFINLSPEARVALSGLVSATLQEQAR